MNDESFVPPTEMVPQRKKFEGLTVGKVSYEEYQSLTTKVENFRGIFAFPGINGADYQKLKADSEEFPDVVTHIDDLVKRFENEGMKVVSEKGHTFVLPYLSSDIDRDSIYPWYLKLQDSMDPDLKALIEAGKEPHLPKKAD